MSNSVWVAIMTAFVIADVYMVYESAKKSNPALATWFAVLAVTMAIALGLRLGGM